MREKPSEGDEVHLTWTNHPKDQLALFWHNKMRLLREKIERWHQPRPGDEEATRTIDAQFEQHWNELLAKDNSDTTLEDSRDEPST